MILDNETDGGTHVDLRCRALGHIETERREGAREGWASFNARIKQIAEEKA